MKKIDDIGQAGAGVSLDLSDTNPLSESAPDLLIMDDVNVKNLGQLIELHLKREKLSVPDFAKKVDASRNTIYSIVRNEKDYNPKLDLLLRICDELGIKMKFFRELTE